MDTQKKIPKILLCGWISPEGNVHHALPREQEHISDALCRELYGISIPLPGEYLLERGWVRVRPIKQLEYRIAPTDKQEKTMKEYQL